MFVFFIQPLSSFGYFGNIFRVFRIPYLLQESKVVSSLVSALNHFLIADNRVLPFFKSKIVFVPTIQYNPKRFVVIHDKPGF